MKRSWGLIFLAVLILALLVPGCRNGTDDEVPTRAKEHFERANDHYEDKEYAEAIQGFQAVVDVYSYTRIYPLALYRLGYSKLNVGRFAEAEGDFADFLSEFPEHQLNDDARLLYARALSEQGKYYEAADNLARVAARRDSRLSEPALESFTEHFQILNREEQRELLHEYESTYVGAYLLYTLGNDAFIRGDLETAALYLRRLADHPLSTEYRAEAAYLLTEVEKLQESRPKVIGCLVPLSGDMAPYGREVKAAVELAAAEYNAAHSRKLEIVTADSLGTPEGAVAGLRALAEESQAVAVIGPLSSNGFRECVYWADYYQLPIITPAATDAELAALSPYAFRNALTYVNQCESLAEFSSDRLNADVFGILYEDTPYGTGMRDAFVEIAPDYGIEVRVEQSYPLEASSYAKECKEFRKRGLDAIFIPGHMPHITELASQIVFLGIVAELVGGNAWNAESVPRMGLRYVEGAIFCDALSQHSRNPRILSFITNFRSRGAKEPTYLAAHAYDSFGLIAQAIDAGYNSRPALAEGLLNIRHYDGLVGDTSVDAEGEAHKNLTIFTILENEIIEFGQTSSW